MPYDPRIGATLSSHEVAQGYSEVEDPSVFVRFQALGEREHLFPRLDDDAVDVAVEPAARGASRRRVRVGASDGDETLILARELVVRVLGGASEHEIVRSARGRELDGLRYERLFDYLPVRRASIVSACGRLSSSRPRTARASSTSRRRTARTTCKLGQQYGLPVLHGVGDDGYFLPEVTPVAGKFFKDADPIIIEMLARARPAVPREKYLHNYPFGWRTGDPLIYYAKNAWYIRTTAYARAHGRAERDDQAGCRGHIREGRFGNWLENNVDWALSRERFWGTPLPLWTDGKGDYICIGSRRGARGARRAASSATLDLHRPAHRRASRSCTRAASTAACRRSSTAGSTRARCPTRSGITRSRTRPTFKKQLSRPTSSARRSIRRAAGSTRCTRSRRWSSDSVAYRTSSA